MDYQKEYSQLNIELLKFNEIFTLGGFEVDELSYDHPVFENLGQISKLLSTLRKGCQQSAVAQKILIENNYHTWFILQLDNISSILSRCTEWTKWKCYEFLWESICSISNAIIPHIEDNNFRRKVFLDISSDQLTKLLALCGYELGDLFFMLLTNLINDPNNLQDLCTYPGAYLFAFCLGYLTFRYDSQTVEKLEKEICNVNEAPVDFQWRPRSHDFYMHFIISLTSKPFNAFTLLLTNAIQIPQQEWLLYTANILEPLVADKTKAIITFNSDPIRAKWLFERINTLIRNPMEMLIFYLNLISHEDIIPLLYKCHCEDYSNIPSPLFSRICTDGEVESTLMHHSCAKCQVTGLLLEVLFHGYTPLVKCLNLAVDERYLKSIVYSMSSDLPSREEDLEVILHVNKDKDVASIYETLIEKKTIPYSTVYAARGPWLFPEESLKKQLCHFDFSIIPEHYYKNILKTTLICVSDVLSNGRIDFTTALFQVQKDANVTINLTHKQRIQMKSLIFQCTRLLWSVHIVRMRHKLQKEYLKNNAMKERIASMLQMLPSLYADAEGSQESLLNLVEWERLCESVCLSDVVRVITNVAYQEENIASFAGCIGALDIVMSNTYVDDFDVTVRETAIYCMQMLSRKSALNAKIIQEGVERKKHISKKAQSDSPS